MKIAFAGVANGTASQAEGDGDGAGDLTLALSGLILAYNGCRAAAAEASDNGHKRPFTRLWACTEAFTHFT